MSAASGIIYLLGRDSPYLPPVISLNEDIPPSNICSPRLAPRSRRDDRVSEYSNSAPPLHNNDHLHESRLHQPQRKNKMAGSDSNQPSERTHLLGQGNRNNGEGKHAIFLRVCHSPWSGITSKLLTIIRGLLAAYLIITFILVMIWQSQEKDHRGEGGEGNSTTSSTYLRENVDPLNEEMVGQFFHMTFATKNETSDDDGRGGDSEGLPDGGWISVFRFETISLFIQMVYAVMTFSWTLLHLISPRHQHTGMETLANKVKKFFAHPTGEYAFLFSLFYVAAVSFPHVVALVYWSIIVPARDIDVDDLFSHGGLQTFAVLNLYLLGSVIALFELFFLNSVRRPGPSYSHILGLTTFAVAYFSYAYIGHLLTGKWAYYFLNYKKEGFENVFVAMLAFIALLSIFYGFIYGLTGIREAVVDGEGGHGYTRNRGVDGGNDEEEGLQYDQYRDRDHAE